MNPFRAIYDFFYIKYKMRKLRRQDPYIYEEEWLDLVKDFMMQLSL